MTTIGEMMKTTIVTGSVTTRSDSLDLEETVRKDGIPTLDTFRDEMIIDTRTQTNVVLGLRETIAPLQIAMSFKTFLL